MNRADNFLKSQKILRLGTVGGDGVPHVVPVWYDYTAGKVCVGTNTRTRKAKNVKGNQAVSFCVDTGVNSPGIFGVMGTGRAVLVTEKENVKKIAAKILCRYFDSLETDSARELLDDTDCIIEIIPDRLTVWEY